MSRSIWKGPFIEKSILTEVLKSKNTLKIKTWSRKSTILPCFIGNQFNIHAGKQFVSLKITEEMLGHKLGEFVPTRVKFLFKKIKIKGKKK